MNLDALLSHRFAPVVQALNARDCMLYAAGIGVGSRPLDDADLQFLYEQRADGLQVFPAFVNVIAHPGAWVRDPKFGIDWVKLLHGEQAFTLHRPLQAGRTYVGHFRVTGVVDKGPGKGALAFIEKQLREQDGDALVSTVTSTYFLRGDGGCGGTTTDAPAPHALPERAPDSTCTLPTLPQAALIYRLSGDHNPVHADPAIARLAGFERPILHGLCSLGVATRAVLQLACDDQPQRLKSLRLRFSAPVYPGETISTEVWRDGALISFRSRVLERDLVVLNNGHAEVDV